MKKPLRREVLTLEGWSQGEGVARLDGHPVALFGTLPQDTVDVLVAKRRKGTHPGWTSRVLAPAAARVEPRCPHFAACGGCTLQHVSYSTQLKLKAAPVEQGLAAAGCLIEPGCPAPAPFYYRSKVELSFDPSGRLGFNRRRRFDQVVDVQECFLAPPGNRAILAAVRRWAHGRPGWNPRTHTGHLRYFVLRRSSATAEWLAVLVTAPGEPPAELAAELSALDATGVLWVEQTSVAGAIVPEREHLLAGRGQIVEKLGELEFHLSWRSFFQSNPPAYRKLLDTARAWLGPTRRLLDLYCGIGTIGLYLAPHQLVGVEAVEPAVEDARRNAERNGRTAEFICAPAESWTNFDCDVLVLDPPRSGCHPKVLQRVEAEGPATVLYISCNPERLLTELNALPSYRPVRAQVFDFFPQTRHIECLTLLVRR